MVSQGIPRSVLPLRRLLLLEAPQTFLNDHVELKRQQAPRHVLFVLGQLVLCSDHVSMLDVCPVQFY